MIILLVLTLIVACFALIAFKGPPYLRTLSSARQDVFDLLSLKPNQIIVDLGCGDGQLLIEAAERGLIAIGYELNPLVYLIAKFRTRKYKSQIQIHLKDFWQQPIQENTDAIFIFLQDRFMSKLEQKLNQQAPKGLKVASFTYKFPNKKPIKQQGIVSLYKF